MIEPVSLRQTITKIRENADLSQAELAKRLTFTASRLSRLESGDQVLTVDEAERIAEAIGSDDAKAFAVFIRRSWRFLQPVGFNHVSREILWAAEEALLRLNDELKEDPELKLKNAFLKQVESCEKALLHEAGYLESTDHPVVLIGSPGVGKTTTICGLTGLRKDDETDLNRQMALQTGSGRTTIGEVQVRCGGEYAVSIDPCSDDELRQYVAEFAEYLLGRAGQIPQDEQSDGPGISIEMQRALRRMAKLTEKRIKDIDGKTRREDPALELARQFPNREDLQIQIHSRLDLSRRKRTSISCPRDNRISGLEWLEKTSADINTGNHPEFSLPKRIEISVPQQILGTDEVDIRLIDTRGVDEPSAPRRDLQAYLDDERAVILLCSGFKDAPDAAVQSVVERAVAGGLQQSLLQRGMVLVLPQEGEEIGVRDSSTGELVSDAEEGREVRRDQVVSTLGNIGAGGLRIEFHNIRRDEDCARLRDEIIESVLRLRHQAEERVRSLISTVDHLIVNQTNEQTRAIFEQAVRPISVWLDNNQTLPTADKRPDHTLLKEIEELRYASTLRASVARKGSWERFDYWHGLGFGLRCDTVKRASTMLTKLAGSIENAIADPELEEVRDFLQHLQEQVESSTSDFNLKIQTLGENVFTESFRENHLYWMECQDRWGKGPGYKTEIKRRTEEWFTKDAPKERYDLIETETQGRWREMLQALKEKISSAGPSNEAGTA